jgi:S-adenosylmethionine:tRNA-ribosyltransferase-isomerase (queuine synthetase)
MERKLIIINVLDKKYYNDCHIPESINIPYEEFKAKITELGETPIPKYIKREVEPEDEERYQTIFASVEGAGPVDKDKAR